MKSRVGCWVRSWIYGGSGKFFVSLCHLRSVEDSFVLKGTSFPIVFPTVFWISNGDCIVSKHLGDSVLDISHT